MGAEGRPDPAMTADGEGERKGGGWRRRWCRGMRPEKVVAAPPEKVGRVGVTASEKVGREVGRDMGRRRLGWVGGGDVGRGRDPQRRG